MKAEIKAETVIRFMPPDKRYNGKRLMRLREQVVYRFLVDGKEVAINQDKRQAKKFAKQHGILPPV